MPFSALIEPLRRAVQAAGYERPTPIQEQAIPHVLAGKDLLGCAQTGTGKTAAFALPMLQRLAEDRSRTGIRALVLSPTRELAAQIGESVGTYDQHLGLHHAVVFGGVSQMHQERALRKRPTVLIATPGRLMDLCKQRVVDLSHVEILVLDEADRMLDMGFIHDVRRITQLIPKNRQTLLFSATLPKEIVDLARNILVDPVRVDVAPATKTADTVVQSVFFAQKADKRALLQHVLRDAAMERVVVFTRTKHGASRVARHLEKSGILADAIHGDKTQGARERALSGFRNGALRVLVATDIAARGIDVDGVTHVVNFDLPAVAESYVHRIGRTGRAGASGIALSFCDGEERPLLADIERLIGSSIRVVSEHPFAAAGALAASNPPPPRPAQNGRPGSRPSHGGQRRDGGGPRGGGQRRDNGGGGQRRDNGGGPRRDHGGGPRRDSGPAPRRESGSPGPRRDSGAPPPRPVAAPVHVRPVSTGSWALDPQPRHPLPPNPGGNAPPGRRRGPRTPTS